MGKTPHSPTSVQGPHCTITICCDACMGNTLCVISLPWTCRFTLELDAIKWHLCQDRTPFVDASIVGVMLDSIQNKDMSGTSCCTPHPIKCFFQSCVFFHQLVLVVAMLFPFPGASFSNAKATVLNLGHCQVLQPCVCCDESIAPPSPSRCPCSLLPNFLPSGQRRCGEKGGHQDCTDC